MSDKDQPDPGEAPEVKLPWARPGILVGVDGSTDSLDALRLAIEIAPELGLPVHALVVWDLATTLYDDYRAADELAHPQDDAKRVVAATRQAAFPDGPPPEWFTIGTERGRPAFVLLSHSSHAAMLALGRRGHGGFLGLLLGSVSAACVSHALCPVLLVPARSAESADEDGATARR
ncbi:universal stress protein [Microbacterium sp. BK668]|uniref:universal stress protein n=1 Tax=Microbacterium sp. BK668 TaxID=2512118 RepID=UPI0010D1513A|nr:universal stress protein [Microbacterium sp. BK668]TDN91614.1 nucleotide-binding universal stress UspA family protein [Microbacterium sp. BK668]